MTAFIPQISETKNAKNPKFRHANCITPKKLGILNQGKYFVVIHKAINAKKAKIKYILLYSFLIFLKHTIPNKVKNIVAIPNENLTS